MDGLRYLFYYFCHALPQIQAQTIAIPVLEIAEAPTLVVKALVHIRVDLGVVPVQTESIVVMVAEVAVPMTARIVAN